MSCWNILKHLERWQTKQKILNLLYFHALKKLQKESQKSIEWFSLQRVA